MPRTITHNPATCRFEYSENGDTSYVAYRPLDNGVWLLEHTEAQPTPHGRAIAADLVHAALSEAQRQGVKVRTECSFTIHYLARHPEFADLEDITL